MTKQQIRQAVWLRMEQEGVARFPGARGRIPNFVGAERCAEKVNELEAWKKAKVIKANPDSPQRPLRHLALKQGKIVYMAVPKLRSERCFVELDPSRIKGSLYEASSIKGAFKLGRQVAADHIRTIDIVLCGSVAVRPDGARVGKGGGYSELEYALAIELGKLNARTPIITTVHPIQIVDYQFELKPYDIPVDFIVTPERIIACDTKLPKPQGIYWEYLSQEKIASIPVLKRLNEQNLKL